MNILEKISFIGIFMLCVYVYWRFISTSVALIKFRDTLTTLQIYLEKAITELRNDESNPAIQPQSRYNKAINLCILLRNQLNFLTKKDV